MSDTLLTNTLSLSERLSFCQCGECLPCLAAARIRELEQALEDINARWQRSHDASMARIDEVHGLQSVLVVRDDRIRTLEQGLHEIADYGGRDLDRNQCVRAMKSIARQVLGRSSTSEPSEQPSRITMINNQVDRELEGFSNAFAIRDRLKAEEAKERAQAPEARREIKARIHGGNEVIVDIYELTQFADVRMTGENGDGVLRSLAHEPQEHRSLKYHISEGWMVCDHCGQEVVEVLRCSGCGTHGLPQLQQEPQVPREKPPGPQQPPRPPGDRLGEKEYG